MFGKLGMGVGNVHGVKINNEKKGNQMKKVLALLLIGLAATSFGVVNVNWNSSYGYFFGATDPGVGILGDATGNSTVAQLVYCGANGLRDKVGINGVALLNDGVTAGDDVVWASFILSEDGIANDGDTFDSYAHFNSAIQNYQQAFTGGNVYARIFQDNNIGGGDWFFYTPVLALVDVTGNNLPQEIEMNIDGWKSINSSLMNPTTGSGLEGTSQVVPEPATFLLLALGGCASWILRRMRLA